MLRSRIAGIGRALPQRVLTNADLEQMVDTTNEWIVERTGIRRRRVLDDDLCTSDLAAEAGRKACAAAGIDATEIDAIIVGTVTPDRPMPATAVYVQQKIGAGCPAFDISAACAGFIYGLAIADGLICRGAYKRILVIGVEILSRIVNWKDRNTCVLFGDGAGAAVVAPEDGEPRGSASAILDLELCADGQHACHLDIPAGGTVEPTSFDTLERKRHYVQMNGRQVFTQGVKNMSAAAKIVLERNGVLPSEVSCVFAHQANMRIIEGVSQRVGISMDRFFNNIHEYGNTSSASIPISLSEAVEQGRIKRGDLVLLTALGAGIAWGAALIRW